ncbi:MAG: 4-(cytidine 5'-diphospho)-2-C-methyl-D-erythritol kinase [Firmicutes bacterium]|nr:4-(cytidine 5'-diphospho)-2-C-methyl-D-erythritol kinase [Bacillota bacterium]
MKSISLKTYAKINISLDVTGVREDGYHEVCMVMQAVDLHDEMTVRLMEERDPDIVLKSNRYYVPTDGRNTAFKAARLMLDLYDARLAAGETPAAESSDSAAADAGDKAAQPSGGRNFGVRIDIGKEIPVAAGLAGGSSNAAGAIVALNALLELHLSVEEMCAIGSRVGADVPFSILSLLAALKQQNSSVVPEGAEVSAAALAEGIGEILTPLPPLKMWTILVKPHFSVATKEVYKALDQISIQKHPDTESVLLGMNTGNIVPLREGMANVLEEVTLVQRPEVAEIRAIMQQHCPDMTMMSGSGPTVFSLFPGKKAALRAYAQLQSELKDHACSIYLAKTLS